MLNQCNFIGNVGKEPTIKTFNDGGKIANFSLAVTKKGYKTKNGKEIPEKTEWINCVVKGNMVSVIENYVSSGSKLFVSCELETRSYEKDGDKKILIEFNVNTLELLSTKKESNNPEQVSNNKTADTSQESDGLPF